MNNTFKDKDGNFVEIDEVIFFPKGGGLAQHMSWHAFHQKFEPAVQPSEFRPVKVTLDTLPADTAFEAYHTGQLWNGWLMPVFPAESVKAIVAATEAAGWHDWVQFKEAENIVCVQDEDEPNGVTTFCQQTIVIDGKPIEVYQVGDGICWEEVTPAGISAGNTSMPSPVL